MPMKRTLEKYGCILLGNAMMAVGVAAFLAPSNIIMGGSTGIALFLNRLFGMDTSLAVLLVNGVLFLLGWLVLGWKFMTSTVASVVCYPLLLSLAQRIPNIERLTTEPVLMLVGAGLFVGMGTGLIVRVGASTGGSDTIGLLLNRLTHLPVTNLVFAADGIIIVVQCLFSTVENIFNSLILLLLLTFFMNRVLVRGQAQLQLFVVTAQYEQVRQQMLEGLSVGVTMVKIETGYQGRECMAVLSVIPRRKLYAAEELIKRADPEAFITISEIKEVKGEGFSFPRGDEQTNRSEKNSQEL